MSSYFYHPFGDNALNAKPFTRPEHGCGKLDMNGNHTPFYAMCDGQIVGVGTYAEGGDFYCTQLCENSALGMPFYIRYLHGDYVVEKGQYVKAGELLGYTTDNNNPNYSDHLHVDFVWGQDWFLPNDKGQVGPVTGSFNDDKTIYTVSGKQLKIKSGIIDFDTLEYWKNRDGSSEYGYCWVVFAQTPQKLEADISNLTSSSLKVTIDDYIAKVFVGLVGKECSWNNAAVAQGTLTVCRNWIYADCHNKLGKTDLSFTQADVQEKNGLADHFARFIKGTNWGLYDTWLNLSPTYINKKVPGTDLTCLEFVKQFMSGGTHWSYIDKAIDNKKATLRSGRTKADTEDLMGFPGGGLESQRVVLIPNFSDWLLDWSYGESTQGLTKPSALLFTSNSNNIITVGKKVIDAHYENSKNIPGQYYSNVAYLDTSVNGRTIHSRRDCSGYICGIWQALGDLSSSSSLTTYNFVSSHPSNWQLISLSSLNYDNSKLKPGDVIFREGATHGHGDGHTELIVKVTGNQVQTYGLGSDSAMIASSTSINYLANDITHYDYILRRNS